MGAVAQAASRVSPGARVIAGDTDPTALARHVADEFWTMPRLDAVDDRSLIEECNKRGIDTILPTRDGELAFWADAKPAFAKAGIGVIVSSPRAVALCLDKLAFAEFGLTEGLPIIPAAENAEAFAPGRVVVKERFGAGAKGVGIDLSATAARVHGEMLADPIFQPFVMGREISIDGWLDAGGRLHGLVLRDRDVIVSGESQVTTTFRAPDLEDQAARIFTALGAVGLAGPAVMQGIVTENGLSVIEVNARFGGASTASIAVGLDLVGWSLMEHLVAGEALPPFKRNAGEVRQVRVPQDLHIHDPDL